MQLLDISTLSRFITRQSLAWGAFCELRPALEVVSFAYIQNKGGWELIDSVGEKHFFRDYRGKVVALLSGDKVVIFQGEEIIFCAR